MQWRRRGLELCLGDVPPRHRLLPVLRALTTALPSDSGWATGPIASSPACIRSACVQMSPGTLDRHWGRGKKQKALWSRCAWAVLGFPRPSDTRKISEVELARDTLICRSIFLTWCCQVPSAWVQVPAASVSPSVEGRKITVPPNRAKESLVLGMGEGYATSTCFV